MHKLSNPYYYLCTIISITIISGIALSSANTYSESANATVTVGSACTLTATVNTAHTAEVPAGSSQTGIGSTTLNTICNDAGGFAIYAVGYSGNEYGNNKMLSGSNYEFNTGTGTSASNWNMKLSQVTTGTYATTIDGGFDSSSYSAIPSTFTKVAHRDSTTDAVGTNPTVGSSISLTYGAYISNTQNAGTYEGKVKFTLVHPANEVPLAPQTTEAGCIRYYPNGSDVEGTMGCQTVSASATSKELLASNFSREGYGFAGWSTTYDYSDSTGFLGPQEVITFTAGEYTGSNPGLSLYAHWIKSAGNLQGWAGCFSMASGAVTALTDQRDDETYAVAKLADGNCWMIENMRLENTNSDNATGALAQGYNASFTGLADSEESPTLFDNVTTANSLYSTDGSTINIISGSNQGRRFPRYNNVNTPTTATDRPNNPTLNSARNSTSNAGMYSYGNYYTWAAAIADTTGYASLEDHNTTSICPSGWQIPLGNTSRGDLEQGASDITNKVPGFSYLDRKMGGTGALQQTAEAANRWHEYPNNFIRSGCVNPNSVYGRGTHGYYWSSTTNLDLDLTNGYVSPISNDVTSNGLSIRCVTLGT